MTGYLAYLQGRLPHRNLCLAGGVALNCVANGRIIDSGRFDAVYVQPAAGDAGTSLGAALAVGSAHGPSSRHQFHNVFLGPTYDEQTIKQALEDLVPPHYRIRQVDQPERQAAELLHNNYVIGWYSGRMELGPRALGARSILASARSALMPSRINARIKRRELFRPLAPAVQAEHAAEYFDIRPPGALVYPFMLATTTVRPGRSSRIPAVVHVDGSARVQTVHRLDNPALWDVLEVYRQLTGVPVLLNTSFNHSDEPIVCTPGDAIRTFLRCDLDALVIGSYAVTRQTTLWPRV